MTTSSAWDQKIMATEPDAGEWITISGVAVALAGLISGWFLRGMIWIAAGGKSDGELAGWRKSVDEKFSAHILASAAMEQRFNLQIQAMELRHHELDRILRDSAPRAEMNAGFREMRDESRESFGEIKKQLHELSNYVHGRIGGSSK